MKAPGGAGWASHMLMQCLIWRSTVMATATRNSRNGRANPYAAALNQVADVKERTKWMLLSVLRQRTGLKLSEAFKLQGMKFDWTEFKAQFNEDYEDLSSKELMAHLRDKFGFKSVDDVRAAFKQQSDIRRSRQRRVDEDLDELGTFEEHDELDELD